MKSTVKTDFYFFSIFTVIIIISASLSVLSQTSDTTNSMGRLEIIINGFSNNDGDCWFALDNSEEVYESEDTVWIGKILQIENNEVIVVIDSLEYGEYAVKVFHDENRNGKLDTDFLGIPDEDYGFSNNVSSWFGPPSWKRAKFLFDKPEMIIKIDVD